MTVPGRPARPNVDQAFLARLAATTVATAMARTPVPTLRPATVVTSEDGLTTLLLDGDDGPVLAQALIPEPRTGDRVMVHLVPPSGAYVVGFIGASRDGWGTASGGGGADEVWIATDEPTPRDDLLLWVDTDATPAAGTWQPLALQAPYTPYAGWRTPQIRQLGDVVEIRGLVHCGGAPGGSFIANGLPSPPDGQGLIFLGSSDAFSGGVIVGATRLDVQPGGYLVNSGPTPQDYLSLSMVRYSVA